MVELNSEWGFLIFIPLRDSMLTLQWCFKKWKIIMLHQKYFHPIVSEYFYHAINTTWINICKDSDNSLNVLSFWISPTHAINCLLGKDLSKKWWFIILKPIKQRSTQALRYLVIWGREERGSVPGAQKIAKLLDTALRASGGAAAAHNAASGKWPHGWTLSNHPIIHWQALKKWPKIDKNAANILTKKILCLPPTHLTSYCKEKCTQLSTKKI